MLFRLMRIGENTPEAVAPVVDSLIQELTERFQPVLSGASAPEEAMQVFRDAIRIAAISELVEQRIVAEKQAFRLGDLLEHFSKDFGRHIASGASESLYVLYSASEFLEFSNPFGRLCHFGIDIDEAALFKAIHKHKPLRTQPLIPFFYRSEVTDFIVKWFEGFGGETRVYAAQKPSKPSIAT